MLLRKSLLICVIAVAFCLVAIESAEACDDSLLLLDYCVDDYGKEWTFWYDWDYDCAFWICLGN